MRRRIYFGHLKGAEEDQAGFVICQQVLLDHQEHVVAEDTVEGVGEDYLIGFLDAAASSSRFDHTIYNGIPKRLLGKFKQDFSENPPVPLDPQQLDRLLAKSNTADKIIPVTRVEP